MKSVVLKIGGSLLSPSEETLFDFAFATKLKSLLLGLPEDLRVYISVGGGHLSRKYQQMATDHNENDTLDIHRIGIAATNLNMMVLHGVLDELAIPDILAFKLYDDFISGAFRLKFGTAKIAVVGASKPGASNDYNALQIAETVGAEMIIDVKNVDGVYSADPKLDPNAQFLPKLSWAEYLNVIGNPTEHKPGAHYPVDPQAAREAESKNVKYVIVGSDMDNLRKIILGVEFKGTIIS